MENVFRVCIAWYKHSRGWENSRQLCKPSTSARVCINVSNSPNLSRVYIRLCKHGKRFLLLKHKIDELISRLVRFRVKNIDIKITHEIRKFILKADGWYDALKRVVKSRNQYIRGSVKIANNDWYSYHGADNFRKEWFIQCIIMRLEISSKLEF